MTILRTAQTSDIPAIAAIHVAGWQAAYGGLVDQAHLDSLSVESRIADWQGWMAAGENTTIIAEMDGQVSGWLAYGRTKTAPPGDSPIRPQYPAEIYGLYLAPDHWRRGIGKALLIEAARRIQALKMAGMCLWVLDGNARAKGFYEAMGGQRIGKKQIEIGPNRLKELCYGWRSLKEITS